VFLHGKHVADVEQTPGGQHRLAYLPDPGATPLSLSMPFARRNHPPRAVEPFLEGLLPDREEARAAIAQEFGASPRNPFALLAGMGLDCAGAVQFTPLDQSDAALGRPGNLVPVDERRIGARLRALRADPAASWSAPAERWSLAGAQAKFALRRLPAGSWAEATGSEPTTHILKPGIGEFRLQALNEHVCLDAARRAGLDAARTEYAEFDGEPAIIVTRYDRHTIGDRLRRLHQEDLCQALSVRPANKYESGGGPTAVRVAALLGAAGTAADRRENPIAFIRHLALNYLIGAPDAHAKNYSVLLAGRSARLAPLYDVASGLPYDTGEHTGLATSAMAIGGEQRFGRVQARHWGAFAEAADLDPQAVVGEVRDLAARLPDAMADALAAPEIQAWSGGLRERLLPPVARLCAVSLRD
jgi:serine/threonine-protein kinase HipA